MVFIHESVQLTGDLADSGVDLINDTIKISNGVNGKTIVTLNKDSGQLPDNLFLSTIAEYKNADNVLLTTPSSKINDAASSQVSHNFKVTPGVTKFEAEVKYDDDVDMIVVLTYESQDADGEITRHTATSPKLEVEYVAGSAVIENAGFLQFNHSAFDVRALPRDNNLKVELTGVNELVRTRQLREDAEAKIIVTVTETKGLKMVNGEVVVNQDSNGDDMEEDSLHSPLVRIYDITYAEAEDISNVWLAPDKLGDEVDTNDFVFGNDKVYEVNISIQTEYEMINQKTGDGIKGTANHLGTISSPSDKPHALENLNLTYEIINDTNDYEKYKLSVTFDQYDDEDINYDSNINGAIEFWYAVEDLNLENDDVNGPFHKSTITVEEDTNGDTTNWYKLEDINGNSEFEKDINTQDSNVGALEFVLDEPIGGQVVNIVGMLRLEANDPLVEAEDIESVAVQIRRSLWHLQYNNKTHPEHPTNLDSNRTDRRQGVNWAHLVNRNNFGELSKHSNQSTSQKLDIMLENTEDHLDSNMENTFSFRVEPTELVSSELTARDITIVIDTNDDLTSNDGPVVTKSVLDHSSLLDVKSVLADGSDTNDSANFTLKNSDTNMERHLTLGAELVLNVTTKTDRVNGDFLKYNENDNVVRATHNDERTIVQWPDGKYGSETETDNILTSSGEFVFGPYYVNPKPLLVNFKQDDYVFDSNDSNNIDNQGDATLTLTLPSPSFLNSDGTFKIETNIDPDVTGMGGYYFCSDDTVVTVTLSAKRFSLTKNDLEVVDLSNADSLETLISDVDSNITDEIVSSTDGNNKVFVLSGDAFRTICNDSDTNNDENNEFSLQFRNLVAGYTYDVNVDVKLYQQDSTQVTMTDDDDCVKSTGVFRLLVDNSADTIKDVFSNGANIRWNEMVDTVAFTPDFNQVETIKIPEISPDEDVFSKNDVRKQDYLNLVQFRLVDISDSNEPVVASFYMGADGFNVIDVDDTNYSELFKETHYVNPNYMLNGIETVDHEDTNKNIVNYKLSLTASNSPFNKEQPVYLEYQYRPLVVYRGAWSELATDGEWTEEDTNAPENFTVHDNFKTYTGRSISRGKEIQQFDTIVQVNDTGDSYSTVVNINLKEADTNGGILQNYVDNSDEFYYDDESKQFLDHLKICVYDSSNNVIGSPYIAKVNGKSYVTKDSNFVAASDSNYLDDETSFNLTVMLNTSIAPYRVGVTANYLINNILQSYGLENVEIDREAQVNIVPVSSIEVKSDQINVANDQGLNELQFVVDLDLKTGDTNAGPVYTINMPGQSSTSVLKLYIAEKDVVDFNNNGIDSNNSDNFLYVNNEKIIQSDIFGNDLHFTNYSKVVFNADELANYSTVGQRNLSDSNENDKNHRYNMFFNVVSRNHGDDSNKQDSVNATLVLHDLRPKIRYTAYKLAEGETVLIPRSDNNKVIDSNEDEVVPDSEITVTLKVGDVEKKCPANKTIVISDNLANQRLDLSFNYEVDGVKYNVTGDYQDLGDNFPPAQPHIENVNMDPSLSVGDLVDGNGSRSIIRWRQSDATFNSGADEEELSAILLNYSSGVTSQGQVNQHRPRQHFPLENSDLNVNVLDQLQNHLNDVNNTGNFELYLKNKWGEAAYTVILQ